MNKMFSFSKCIIHDILLEYKNLYLIIPDIQKIILKVGPTLDLNEYQYISPNIWIHKTCSIGENVTILGPAIIGENVKLRRDSFLRENVIISKNSLIGNNVEIKNSILFEEVKIPHLSYVGDSILGYQAHLGASSIISNVRLDKNEIHIKWNNTKINTHLKKFGALIGDEVEIGSHVVINPGTIVGKGSYIYPLISLKGTIPPYMIIKDANYKMYL